MTLRRYLSCIAVLTMSFSAWAMDIKVGFVERPAAEIHSLRDIIRIYDRHESDANHILDVPVPAALRQQQFLTRSDVEKLLHSHAPVLAASTRWVGVETLLVRKPRIAEQHLAWDQASTFLEAQLGRVFSEFEFSPIMAKPNSVVQLGAGECSLNWDVQAALPSKAPVVCRNAYLSAIYWFQLHVFEDVLVATREISSKQAIDSSAVALQRRDIAGSGNWMRSLPESSFGYSAISSIADGAMLRLSQVKQRAAVNRGEAVMLNVRTSNVAIGLSVKALHDADIGELVSVQAQHPKRRLQAKVIASGQVEL